MLMLSLTLRKIQINCDYDNLNYSLYYAFTLITKVEYCALVKGSFDVVQDFVFQTNPSFTT